MPRTDALARKLPLITASPQFHEVLQEHGLPRLRRSRTKTLQVNLGKLCNMACQHCHVEAGPKRTEIMGEDVARRVVELLSRSPEVEVVDLTGGAPELNPHFRWLVGEVRDLGRRVIDRCNLTVLFERGCEDLAAFLAAHRVEVVASLPCYSADNVDKQRGRGAFDKSVEALKRLNALGYGRPDSPLKLSLVYNPVGPSLPPAQQPLEARYKRELFSAFGIEFHELLTITNMPIKRFSHALEHEGALDAYQELLVSHFNIDTVPGLMCRSLVSVSWDGKLFDCDFNQMRELSLGAQRRSLWDIDKISDLEGTCVATADHCFGCTAGAGSSCSGALQ